jgi:hypothetical protein
MTVSTIPPVTPLLKFFDNNGAPLAYGKLFTYQTATSTKQATYTDSTGNTPNTNPIILNARGECSVWLDSSLVYKLVLAPSTDTDPPSNPIWTQDPIGAFSITQLTGNFSTVTVSGTTQTANLVVTGATIPTNGIYLPAVNRLGFATNTKARGYIDSAGIWTLLAPDASGPTLVVPALGTNNTNTLQFPTAGSMMNMARSTDAGLSLFVGSRASTSSLSLHNNGGTSAEVEVDTGTLRMYTNAVRRANCTSAGQWQFYDPYNSINAEKNAATMESGTFTGTLTGCTTSPTATFNWSRTGNIVSIVCAAGLTALSNSTSCTVTGLPANIQPARSYRAMVIVTSSANGITGAISVSNGSSTITLHAANNAAPAVISSSNFVNDVLSKGWNAAATMTYTLD